jgi:hypothetical protein
MSTVNVYSLLKGEITVLTSLCSGTGPFGSVTFGLPGSGSVIMYDGSGYVLKD